MENHQSNRQFLSRAVFFFPGLCLLSPRSENPPAKVLDTSPFYAEAGGQVGDLGLLTNAAGAETEEVAISWDFHRGSGKP